MSAMDRQFGMWKIRSAVQRILHSRNLDINRRLRQGKDLRTGIKADEILYSPLIRKGHGTPYRRDYRIPAREEARLKEQNFGKYESTPRDGAEFREAKTVCKLL